jgi:hypothetical protein
MAPETYVPTRDPFDPRCCKWASFAELRVGDRIDHWGGSEEVVLHSQFDDGRVHLMIEYAHGGKQFALAPGATTFTWRELRPEEIAAGESSDPAMSVARGAVRDLMRETYGDLDRTPPECCGHVFCLGDGKRCGYTIAAFSESFRCECTGTPGEK